MLCGLRTDGGGLLLECLPGPFGILTFGAEASHVKPVEIVDAVKGSGQSRLAACRIASRALGKSENLMYA